jgi:WD40 repeat protein
VVAKEWIEALRFSPDGKWLAVGSHDNFIYILNTAGYAEVGKIMKSSSYITALDWSCDSSAIHTCDGSYELLYYCVDANGKIEHAPDGATKFRDEKWSTYSTHFGWAIQGIFGGNIDYTHINRVDRSSCDQFFAVGNDWGQVEIYNNPNSEGAKSKAFRAHSEHVTNVKWTPTHVFSAGGYDQCVMQWKKQ